MDRKPEAFQVTGELLFELADKQEWINKVPKILPKKTRRGEQWIWVDRNGYVFERGEDFMAAEKNDTYPCRVYRLCNVSEWTSGYNSDTFKNSPLHDKNKIIEIMDSLSPEKMVKVVEFLMTETEFE